MKPLTTERIVEIFNGEHDPFESEIRRMCREILISRGLLEMETATAPTVERVAGSEQDSSTVQALFSGLLLRGGES